MIYGTLQREQVYEVTLCDRYFALQQDFGKLEENCIVSAR